MRYALNRLMQGLTSGGRRIVVLCLRLLAAVAAVLGTTTMLVRTAVTAVVRGLWRACARAVHLLRSAVVALTNAAVSAVKAVTRGIARAVAAILAAGHSLQRRVVAGLTRTCRCVMSCGRAIIRAVVARVAGACHFAISCGQVIIRAVVAGGGCVARVGNGAARVLARGAARFARLLASAVARAVRGVRRLVRPAVAALAGVSRMVARRSPVRGLRLWLMLGIPLAGVAGLSSVASISVLPPSMHLKSMGFAIASSEISVETPTSSGNAPVLRDLFPLPQWAAVLAEELTSPQLKTQVAGHAKIPVGQLAIDGPVSLDLQRTQQEPTQQKRSYQLLSEGDPYRVTLDTDPNLAAVTVTAQAPSDAAARELAHAVDQAAAAYLTATQDSAHLPAADRVGVSPLQPVAITGGSGGHTLAALIFLIVYLLWCGAVCVCRKLVADIRALRLFSGLLPPQVGAAAIRSSIGRTYSDAGCGGKDTGSQWN